MCDHDSRIWIAIVAAGDCYGRRFWPAAAVIFGYFDFGWFDSLYFEVHRSFGNKIWNEVAEDTLVWIPAIGASAALAGYLIRSSIRSIFALVLRKETQALGGRSDAIMTLQKLDTAIVSIRPEKYWDDTDAAIELSALRVSVNTMLGRPQTERFFPVEYNAVVDRIEFYSRKGLLDELMKYSCGQCFNSWRIS